MRMGSDGNNREKFLRGVEIEDGYRNGDEINMKDKRLGYRRDTAHQFSPGDDINTKDKRDWELEKLLENDADEDLRNLMREAAMGKNEGQEVKAGKKKWWREILPPHIWKFLKGRGHAGKVVRLPMFPTKNYPEDIVRELYIYRLAGRRVYVPKYYRSLDEDWVVCARILKRQGRNIREIAEILGKSANTIRRAIGEG